MSKVVALDGSTRLPELREPQQAVVDLLRQLLIDAESGELQGVAVVGLNPDRLSWWSCRGLTGSYSMVGASVHLTQHLIEQGRD